MPFSLPVTFLHTANLQTIDRPLSLSPIISLSLSKSPSKSYRGNWQQKINIGLVNSLTPIKDTVKSYDESLDGGYLCCWGSSPYKKKDLDRQQSYLYHIFKIEKTSCWLLVGVSGEWFHCSSHPPSLPLFERAPSMKYHFGSRFYQPSWEKEPVWKQARDCTSISHWSQGVDNSHSWTRSIFKGVSVPTRDPLTIAFKRQLSEEQKSLLNRRLHTHFSHPTQDNKPISNSKNAVKNILNVNVCIKVKCVKPIEPIFFISWSIFKCRISLKSVQAQQTDCKSINPNK